MFPANTPSSADARTLLKPQVMDRYMYGTAVRDIEWDAGDPAVTPANIQELAERIVNNIKERAAWYRTSEILFPWGNDFQHYNATKDFDNMDQLVDYINAHQAEYNVTVKYGEFILSS